MTLRINGLRPDVRCRYGHRAGPARESSRFFISYGTHTGPARDPQGCRTAPLRTRKGIDTTRVGKIPHGCRIWSCYGARTVPTRAVHGLFTICKPVRGPKTYNACIKTLRAPYGEAKSERRRTGPVQTPWVDVRLLLKTTREQPVRGPGVWCDWGIRH